MKKPVSTFAFLVLAVLPGCVSLTPGGAKVRVYETDRPSSDAAARPPAGCRLLGSEGAIDQQAPERLVEDPYRVQRNATAEKGGNVLLLRSRVIRDLPKTECPPGDRSPDCQQTLSTWYRVDFESYACDEPALSALSAARADTGSGKPAWWWPFGSKKSTAAPAPATPLAAASAPPPAPPAASPAKPMNAELKAKIFELLRENVGTDVIVAYVRSRSGAAPLSADEIVDWKRSGIADAVIEAAIAQASR